MKKFIILLGFLLSVFAKIKPLNLNENSTKLDYATCSLKISYLAYILKPKF